ncbi:glycosyltransferase [Ketogulonicigenium vulgare]|nr:glycosyltransferase [Ketogulonicigenium vulgare]
MHIKRVCLVPPADPGSKGDEGMVRGALDLFDTLPIVIIGPDGDGDWAADLALSPEDAGRITWLAQPIAASHDIFRDGDLLFVVGADVLDGTCGMMPAKYRLDLMQTAEQAGVPVYAHCSFRSDVAPEILAQIDRLKHAVFLLRDGLSMQNFERQTARRGHAFSDMSFFYRQGRDTPRAVALRDSISALSKPIIGLNFAEHSFRSFSDTHDTAARGAFVAAVLTQIVDANPTASFVLLSNDRRRFENHPPDDDYSDMAAKWITTTLAPSRFVQVGRASHYADNIALLASCDLLVTGRMHLALAAMRAGTMPLVVMGQGKGYTSIDKMRGAFLTHLGSDMGVVDDLAQVGAISAALLAQGARALHDYNSALEAKSNREKSDLLANIAERTEHMFEMSPDEHTARNAYRMSIIEKLESELAIARQDQAALEAARQAHDALQRAYDTIMQERAEIVQTAAAQQAELQAALELAELKFTAADEFLKETRAGHADVISDLARAGAHIAESARRAEAQPLRMLKRRLRYGLTKLLLRAEGRMSQARAERLRRSLAKRKPKRHIEMWQAAVLRAGGHHPAIAQQHQLAGDGQGVIAPSSMSLRKILVADYRLPRPDVSAGEKATVGVIADMVAMGYQVTFISTDMQDTAPYRAQLEAIGVEVITATQGYAYANDYIDIHGHKFGTFYFIRVDVAEALLTPARLASPQARIIFHAPDLYFLREERAAAHSKNADDMREAAKTRARESKIMQASDHVVLVSAAEIDYLTDIIPCEKISVVPALYCPVVAEPAGFAARKDIFFLGGFKHLPNISAVKWFVQNVWPKVHAALPDVEFHIVGAEAPGDVVSLGRVPGVRFVGYVADLDPVLAQYRISAAPLLFGAGIKGKVGMAMGAGVPTVMSTIAAEGMSIVDGIHGLVRDDPDAFAEALIALYGDQLLWERLAVNGADLVDQNFSEAANRASVYRMLERARALPVDLYSNFIAASSPAAFPHLPPEVTVDVSIIIPVHDQWALTKAALIAVQRAMKATGITAEVILADDASSDETQQAAQIFPGLRVMRHEENLGFLLNANAAAEKARGQNLLFLNNDTIVLPGWLDAMFATLHAHPDAAIIGAKLLYPDGTIQEVGGALFADGSASCIGRGRSPHDRLFTFDREVDYATGASILVRREFWDEVGGFDARYAPAYCEDSDLAIAARARGYQVWCAAHAQVLHFEHASYGQQITQKPKERATANLVRLVDKWQADLTAHYLPPQTAPMIVAAHAERHASAAAIARRASGKLNILYFSPFPSHPDNHGNQATIQSFGRRFKAMGHKVHFALLRSDMYDENSMAAMKAAWDSLDILPNVHPLGSNGEAIAFDGWYQDGTGEAMRVLCDKYDIDVVFCSYVFQSKLLDYVPEHVLKVIDTHDRMGGRYEMLRANGQPVEFFSCTPEEEGAYLRRADLVGARRAEEAGYFDEVAGRSMSIVLPHVEEARFLDRSFTALNRVGIVASANRINLVIVRDFLNVLAAKYGDNCPFTVELAGQVSGMVKDLPAHEQQVFNRPWLNKLGFVADIKAFYESVDLVISPVTMGTGINVKTVQAMAFGMPLLSTRVGIKGIETGDPLHGHETLTDLVEALDGLVAQPSELQRLAAVSRARYLLFLADTDASFEALLQHPKLTGQ